MAEYIEKEALDHAFFLLGYGESDLPRRMLGRMAAADVVPVVRCKDCHYYVPDAINDGVGLCENIGIGQLDMNFCSDGERKTINENDYFGT